MHNSGDFVSRYKGPLMLSSMFLLIFFLSSLARSLTKGCNYSNRSPHSLPESIEVSQSFKSMDLWMSSRWDHSNESYWAWLSRGAACFSIFYKKRNWWIIFGSELKGFDFRTLRGQTDFLLLFVEPKIRLRSLAIRSILYFKNPFLFMYG